MRLVAEAVLVILLPTGPLSLSSQSLKITEFKNNPAPTRLSFYPSLYSMTLPLLCAVSRSLSLCLAHSHLLYL